MRACCRAVNVRRTPARARRIAQTVGVLPPAAPALNCRHTTAQPLHDGSIRPFGRTKRAQHNLRSLHDSEQGHVTSTQVLQPSFLLGRQCDHILGTRARYSYRPLNSVKVGKTGVCQPFLGCKPAPYFLRSVHRRPDSWTVLDAQARSR